MSNQLSARRISLLRAGYLLMGLGLAVVKWPMLVGASDLPLYEGVTLSLLTAMSLLALLGARRPLRFLPVLLLEVTWKTIWLAAVALPRANQGTVDDKTQSVIGSCSLVLLILAVIPWPYVWRSYVSPRSTAKV